MISVIVPIYNVEKYLAQCLQSIIDQTYRDIEIILVDDGSSDASGAICDEFQKKDSRIKVIHTENGGVSRARNIGLSYATGEYIAFVDGDDYILETMYEKLYNAIEDKDIVFCRFAHVHPNKVVLYKEENLENLIKRPFDFKYIMVDRYSRDFGDIIVCDKIHGSVCRQLFLRRIIAEKGIQFKEDVKIAEDRLFLLEYLGYCNSASYVDEHLYSYRMENPNSATSVFRKYRIDLPQSQKSLIDHQVQLLHKHTRLSLKEKNRLKDFLIYKAINAVVLNEMHYNIEESPKNLRAIFKDPFFRDGMTIRCLLTMKQVYGEPVRMLILGLMIKFRLWSLIGMLLK